MNTYYVVRPVGQSLWAACRFSRPAGLFPFGLLADYKYAYAGLTCEMLRRASVSNASQRHV